MDPIRLPLIFTKELPVHQMFQSNERGVFSAVSKRLMDPVESLAPQAFFISRRLSSRVSRSEIMAINSELVGFPLAPLTV